MEMSMALLVCGRCMASVATPSEIVTESEFIGPPPAPGAFRTADSYCQTRAPILEIDHAPRAPSLQYGTVRLHPGRRCAKIERPHRRVLRSCPPMSSILPRPGRRTFSFGKFCALALGLAAAAAGSAAPAGDPAGNETPAEFKP